MNGCECSSVPLKKTPFNIAKMDGNQETNAGAKLCGENSFVVYDVCYANELIRTLIYFIIGAQFNRGI